MEQAIATGSLAAIGITRNCLVLTLQADLYDDLLERIRQSIIERVSSGALLGVILDLSSVRVLNSHITKHLTDTAKIIQLMGSRTAFVGFRPGVVSALIDLGLDVDTINAFRTIEEAIAYLSPSTDTPGTEIPNDCGGPR